ncbi:EpsG family protein [bacterium]|nr:EpsG family protein [bacterium]
MPAVYVIFFIGFVAVAFAYIARFEKMRFCLNISFFIIFLFLALRYNYGNDYGRYLYSFDQINQKGIYAFTDTVFDTFVLNIILDYNLESQTQFIDVGVEPGWVALCLLFKPFGFFAMVAFLALFHCIVYYWFIKKYVPSCYYWLAVFFYIFHTNLMLQLLQSLRQSIAISIFLISIDYIYKRKFFTYAGLIFFAWLFHASAILMLPLYMLGVFRSKTNFKMIMGIMLLFVILFLFHVSMHRAINVFISEYATKYLVHQESSIANTGLGIAYYVIVMFLILICDRYQNYKVSLVNKIAILTILIIPFSFAIMMVGRVGLYFLPCLMVAYPNMLIQIRRTFPKDLYFIKYVILIALISMNIFFFTQFFQHDLYIDEYSKYQTILSAPSIY